MNDQEKSVLIARAMGLQVRDVLVNPIQHGFGGEEAKYCTVIFYTDPAGYARETTDMYAGSQGAEIAWMALNWITDTKQLHNEEFCMWWAEANLFNLPWQEARRRWLDEIVRYIEYEEALLNQ